MRDFSFQVKLKTMIDVTMNAMKQFNMLGRCCPDRNQLCSLSFVPYEYLSQVAGSHMEDDIMKHLFELIEVKYQFDWTLFLSLLCLFSVVVLMSESLSTFLISVEFLMSEGLLSN